MGGPSQSVISMGMASRIWRLRMVTTLEFCLAMDRVGLARQQIFLWLPLQMRLQSVISMSMENWIWQWELTQTFQFYLGMVMEHLARLLTFRARFKSIQ